MRRSLDPPPARRVAARWCSRERGLSSASRPTSIRIARSTRCSTRIWRSRRASSSHKPVTNSRTSSSRTDRGRRGLPPRRRVPGLGGRPRRCCCARQPLHRRACRRSNRASATRYSTDAVGASSAAGTTSTRCSYRWARTTRRASASRAASRATRCCRCCSRCRWSARWSGWVGRGLRHCAISVAKWNCGVRRTCARSDCATRPPRSHRSPRRSTDCSSESGNHSIPSVDSPPTRRTRLRTPMAAIRAQAEVARDAEEARTCERALDRVIEGCDRAARLVEQLLMLARVDEATAGTNHVSCRLDAIVHRVLVEQAPWAMEQGATLDLEAVETTSCGVIPCCSRYWYAISWTTRSGTVVPAW